MKDASTTILKEIGNLRNSAAVDLQQAARFHLAIVAQAFVDLQQARHKADYDVGEPFPALDAAIDVAQARLAFQNWAEIRNEPLAQAWLYSLLFKARS